MFKLCQRRLIITRSLIIIRHIMVMAGIPVFPFHWVGVDVGAAVGTAEVGGMVAVAGITKLFWAKTG
jgi:hypothetical protein